MALFHFFGASHVRLKENSRSISNALVNLNVPQIGSSCTTCSQNIQWNSFLYANLRHSIVWPDKDTLRKIMPHQFMEPFEHRVAVITDCFEFFTEKPRSLKMCTQMFSSYKHNHTIKYLIGITLKGSIYFLSKRWAGCTSDNHITHNSGFLDNLLPGDIVLADRRFDEQESVGMLSAEVKLPAFKKGRCQLAAD